METGDNQQALHRILDFTRLSAVIVLLLHTIIISTQLLFPGVSDRVLLTNYKEHRTYWIV